MDRKATLGTKLYVERATELAAEPEERSIRFIASDETIDRYGDVVSVDGWQLKNFQENPIFLWGHDYNTPIGRVVKVGVENHRLMATARLASEGASQFIDGLWALIREKIVRAVSVGFTVNSEDDYEAIRDANERVTGLHFLRQELLEISLVAVPANPSALLVARGLGLPPDFIQRALPMDASIHAERLARSRRLQAAKLAAFKYSAPR